MKTKILILFALFPLFCFGQNNVIDIKTSIILQSKFIDSNDCKSVVIFSEKEKGILNQVLVNHLKNEYKLQEGFFFKPKSGWNIHFTSENLKERSVVPKNRKNWKDIPTEIIDDFYIVSETYPKMDSIGDIYYDSTGDDIFITTSTKYNFNRNIHSITNYELWSFNNSHFTKFIKFNSLRFNNYTNLTAKYSNKNTIPILLKKNIIYNQILFPEYYNLFLNNKKIGKSKYIEFIQNSKYTFEISKKEQIHLLQKIFTSIKNSKTKTYLIENDKISFNRHLSVNELYAIFDSLQEQKNDVTHVNGGSFYTYHPPISSNDIIGFQFHEDWYIDENNFNITKKVKGLVILIENYDRNGVLIGYKKLPFYISFED